MRFCDILAFLLTVIPKHSASEIQVTSTLTSKLNHLIVITANFRELENMEDASFYDSSEGAFTGHTNQAIHRVSASWMF